MNLKQSHKTIILTIVFFAFYLILKQYFSTIKENLDTLTKNGLLSYVLTYSIIGIPIYIGTYLINSKQNIVSNLGLNHNPIKPFFIALLFSLPMILGGLFFFEFNKEISIPNLVAGTIVVGFVEELFYRGFLFGQLFKYAKLGFISVIILGAIIFATGHLYQSQDTFELIGIFLITFMGAILFAWLYVEWNYNLWIPIYLQTVCDLTSYLLDSTFVEEEVMHNYDILGTNTQGIVISSPQLYIDFLSETKDSYTNALATLGFQNCSASNISII